MIEILFGSLSSFQKINNDTVERPFTISEPQNSSAIDRIYVFEGVDRGILRLLNCEGVAVTY